ncbi:hypothetical protein [Streptomyces bugieae]|uniref:VWA domain-containing protein n=1 Tax=Streptomyces bugieae TaxID=3098223 RepID=A0ABU7P0V7_9ACTN|nr:hypothetical protein [Streptomyces sp. DSM 41528]
MRGEAWLADLVRAAHQLGVTTDAEWAGLAALLGLGGTATACEPLGGRPAGTVPAVPDTGPATAQQTTGTAEDPAGHPAGPEAEPADDPETALLTPVDRAAPRAFGWTVDPLPPPRDPSEPADPPPHMPLFAPRSTAALLRTALARITMEGELDFDRATEQVAQARPLTEIPRRPLPTLRHGVQILADVSASMEPFARDVEDVIARVRAVVGAAGTQVLRFADLPTRGAGTGSRGTWQPYTPPRPGTRVLILSDLGAGGPVFHPWRATAAQWEATVATIRRGGCEAIAFVPLPEHRWPRSWRRLLPVVAWDRGTTVSKVKGARR